MLGAQYMLPKCTKPVGGVSHTQHSVCCRKPNRTDVLYFWEKKVRDVSQDFPFFFGGGGVSFFLQRISFVFLERGGQLELLLCFVFITVDDLLKSVGFFACRVCQQLTHTHREGYRERETIVYIEITPQQQAVSLCGFISYREKTFLLFVFALKFSFKASLL